MSTFKKIIKDKIKQTDIFQTRLEKKYYNSRQCMFDKLLDEEKAKSFRHVYYKGNKLAEYKKLLETINITLNPVTRFQSWIDTGLFFSSYYSITDNIPPNYGLILEYSIDELININRNYFTDLGDDIVELLQAVRGYIERILVTIADEIKKSDKEENTCNLKKTSVYFSNMLTKKCSSLEEALQRILFWSTIFWQSQHRLVGIGRLDKLLDFYQEDDVDACSILVDFFNEIHRYYAYKSNGKILGDTGQIIIIGGLESDGSYFCNKYTYVIVQALKRNLLPDPKILLRVSKFMPDDLLREAIDCISTGVGSPLLSNDDIVIPSLCSFGYSVDDAHNYVTSACWEPLAYGKSLEKNNIYCINYATCFERLYKSEDFIGIVSFDDIIYKYLNEVEIECNEILNKLNALIWEEDPLTSMFTGDCAKNNRDISKGGAVYNNYGVLTVGLANAVDSLLNIKKKCFVEKQMSLCDVRNYCMDNSTSQIEFDKWYGRDDDVVFKLIDLIVGRTADVCNDYRNMFGGKIKWGLSAPNYVEYGLNVGTSFDGRKKGMPLAVHISNSAGVAYTELISFASKLDYYGQKSNGNVVDFFISADFMNNNKDKFFLFIKKSIELGFFQLQINVTSSKMLIEAKENPDLYPNLIVRVWGYSAYFNDLPDSYQDLLIKRAIEMEKTNQWG